MEQKGTFSITVEAGYQLKFCQTVDELLRPYQVGAIHAGMVWKTPIIAYGMGTNDAAKNIAEGANLYRQTVEALIGTGNAGNSW